MRIVVIGDIHESVGNLEDINDISKASCVIINGDLTNVGGIERAKKVIEYINYFNPSVYAQAGNFDRKEVETYLIEQGISLHGNGFIKGNIGIFGVGGSNKTPFGTPNEFEENEIESFIFEGYKKVKNAPLKLFISHAPPFHSSVDIVTSGQHVGSKAVRAFIDNYQPDVCITGHIHEAKGEDRIGQTRIINPGPFKNGGYVEIIEEKGFLRAILMQ
ncbi:MAG: metallophosphoesterase family protein [bacterium]